MYKRDNVRKFACPRIITMCTRVNFPICRRGNVRTLPYANVLTVCERGNFEITCGMKGGMGVRCLASSKTAARRINIFLGINPKTKHRSCFFEKSLVLIDSVWDASSCIGVVNVQMCTFGHLSICQT
jgi:hypothetical protein